MTALINPAEYYRSQLAHMLRETVSKQERQNLFEGVFAFLIDNKIVQEVQHAKAHHPLGRAVK